MKKNVRLLFCLLPLLLAPAAGAKTVKVLERLSPTQVLVAGGRNTGFAQGEKLIAHNGETTLGWVTLVEVGAQTSVGHVAHEATPGTVRAGAFLANGPPPLAPPNTAPSPEKWSPDRSAMMRLAAPVTEPPPEEALSFHVPQRSAEPPRPVGAPPVAPPSTALALAPPPAPAVAEMAQRATTPFGQQSPQAFTDPFKKPLPPPTSPREIFVLQQLSAEAHDSKQNPDDFYVALVAVGRPLGEKTLGSVLVLDRYNGSRSKNATLVMGLNVTHQPGENWQVFGTLTHNKPQSGSSGDGATNLSLGVQRQLGGTPQNGLSAQATSTWPLEDGDTTWDARLDWRTPWGKKNAAALGYSYTYNQDLQDSFLQEFSAGLSRAVGGRGRVNLEALWVDPLFKVDPASVKPQTDHVLRLSYTQVN